MDKEVRSKVYTTHEIPLGSKVKVWKCLMEVVIRGTKDNHIYRRQNRLWFELRRNEDRHYITINVSVNQSNNIIMWLYAPSGRHHEWKSSVAGQWEKQTINQYCYTHRLHCLTFNNGWNNSTNRSIRNLRIEHRKQIEPKTYAQNTPSDSRIWNFQHNTTQDY